VRSFGNPNPIIAKEKHKGAKRSYRGTLLTLPDVEALEAVEPSSSHVGGFEPELFHHLNNLSLI
jgi:hypothetical protein